MSNTAQPYIYEIHDSVLKVEAREWERLTEDGDLAMSQALIDLMQRSLADQAQFWTVAFRDQQAELIACANLCLFRIDVAQSAPKFVQKCLNFVRKVWPNILREKVLFCGLPIPSGHSHLRFSNKVDPKPVLILLDRIMQTLARQQGAQLIALKEFDTEQMQQVSGLKDLKYYCAQLEPLFKLTSSFENFTQYLEALRSNYRHQISKNMKKFSQSHLQVEHISDPNEINIRFTEEVYQLYLSTWSRAKEKLECITPQFFRELTLALPSQVLLTLISAAKKPIAFSIGLIKDANYYNLYVGLDYNSKDESDLYFNLFYHEIANLFSLQKKYIYLGQTSSDFKLRLGALPDDRFFYVRALHPVIRLIFALFHPVIFPKLASYEKKNVFK